MSVQDRLWDIAIEQYGYVTTRDAKTIGAGAIDLTKLAHRGQLARVAHGVYRFDQLPVTARDEFMLAVLWTGSPQAALSHDTALAAYDLCDINPNKIHLIVPKESRIRRHGGDDYVLHRDDLATDQIGWWEGIRTVAVSPASPTTFVYEVGNRVRNLACESLFADACCSIRERAGQVTANVKYALLGVALGDLQLRGHREEIPKADGIRSVFVTDLHG